MWLSSCVVAVPWTSHYTDECVTDHGGSRNVIFLFVCLQSWVSWKEQASPGSTAWIALWDWGTEGGGEAERTGPSAWWAGATRWDEVLDTTQSECISLLVPCEPICNLSATFESITDSSALFLILRHSEDRPKSLFCSQVKSGSTKSRVAFFEELWTCSRFALMLDYERWQSEGYYRLALL